MPRSPFRPRAALVSLVTSVALAGGGLLSQPATADGETAPPVAVDDSYTWYAGGSGFLDVLANDSDPQDAELAVCKVKADEASEIGIAQLLDGQILAFTSPNPTGDLVFRYYACNDEFLTPATVTIALVRAEELRVHKIPGRPGKLEVTNRNDHAARFLWGNPNSSGELDGMARIPASGSKVVTVASKRVIWFGTIGREQGFAGFGRVHGIQVAAGERPTGTVHLSARIQRLWAAQG
ncbi:MAG: hypothetical protein JWO76_984 [Nocardioides sp.]|nr:hypothetical protein [Nocardioides sp.]